MSTILVTGAGGPAGLALARQFARWRAEGGDNLVIGADMVELDSRHFGDTVVVPRADDLRLIPALREVVGRFDADLVIPTVAEELVPVSAAARLLGAQVVVSGVRPAALCADKLLTMWALDEAGVSVPRYGLPSEFTTAHGALRRMGGSVVVKPRVSRGGRGVQVVDRPEDLVWAELEDDQIVQEFAPGTEYAPQVYRSPATGRVDVVVLEKTELKQGRVGNASAVTRLPADRAEDIVYLATQAATALDLEGPLDMDIRRLENGVPVLLEVNARFGANSHLAPELLTCVLRDYTTEKHS